VNDAIPREVLWSALAGGLASVAAVVAIFVRRDRPRGLDRLIALGPLCYAAPLAAFGTEHFTLTGAIASLVPAWLPWHELWVYVIGAAFIAAALSVTTGILARFSASAVAATFLLFVVLMDVPAWVQEPGNRIALTLALRELAFSGGALALAATLTRTTNARAAQVLATIARYCIAIAVLVFSFEQLTHGDRVPAVPLDLPTPTYIVGHAVWTYLSGAVFAVAGVLLVVNRHTRAAATWLGASVVFVVLVVYVPFVIEEHASLEAFNFFTDTLMFAGAVLLLAGTEPRYRGA
jgi:uncharacterized membrane protein YphA (DoxX/SURF4 family)